MIKNSRLSSLTEKWQKFETFDMKAFDGVSVGTIFNEINKILRNTLLYIRPAKKWYDKGLWWFDTWRESSQIEFAGVVITRKNV